MPTKKSATVVMFGSLYTLQKQRGLSPHLEISLDPAGRSAIEIACELNLPLEMIGNIYCNHLFSDLSQVIRPGDRVAFVPRSIPGPHSCLQGFPRPQAPLAAAKRPRTPVTASTPMVNLSPISI